MNKQAEYLNDIAEIKSLMERSSRFISLSGLSGVVAGIIALMGAFAVYYYLDYEWFYSDAYESIFSISHRIKPDFLSFVIIDGLAVLVLALFFGYLFTRRKAKRQNLPMWDNTARNMVLNLLIPLAAGGVFCIILIQQGLIFLVAPATLIFYGLALVNASRYTLNEIRYLGYTEIILGLFGAAFIGYGLVIWALGFGVLHIIYGTIMYNRYEKIRE